MSNTLNYEKVWESMNELNENTEQLLTIRTVIEDTIPYVEKGEVELAIQLLQAASVLLKVYIEKFDKNFEVAWNNTVSAMVRDESYNDFADKLYAKLEERDDSFYKEQE